MRRALFLCVLGLTLAAGVALAQMGEPPGAGVGGFTDQILEIKRTNLGPALGVDQRTVDQLLAIEQRYKAPRQQMKRDMIGEFQRLQQLMGNPSPSEPEVKVTLDNLNRRRLEMLNLQQRQQEEEMAILTPLQQARYLLYLMNLRQEIAKEARVLKGGPPGGPGGTAPKPPRGIREVPVFRPNP